MSPAQLQGDEGTEGPPHTGTVPPGRAALLRSCGSAQEPPCLPRTGPPCCFGSQQPLLHPLGPPSPLCTSLPSSCFSHFSRNQRLGTKSSLIPKLDTPPLLLSPSLPSPFPFPRKCHFTESSIFTATIIFKHFSSSDIISASKSSPYAPPSSLLPRPPLPAPSLPCPTPLVQLFAALTLRIHTQLSGSLLHLNL